MHWPLIPAAEWSWFWGGHLVLCRTYPGCLLLPKRFGPGCQLWLSVASRVQRIVHTSLARKRGSRPPCCFWMFDTAYFRTRSSAEKPPTFRSRFSVTRCSLRRIQPGTLSKIETGEEAEAGGLVIPGQPGLRCNKP